MARPHQLPIAPQIQDEAADWVARRDGGGFNPEQQKAFEAWLDASPAHRAAFDRYDALWNEFDLVVRQAAPPAPVAANDRGSIRKWAVAAAAAVVLVGSSTMIGLRLFSSPAFETAIGEQRTVTLDDGSRVTLNTATRFTTDFAPDWRIIQLDKGEALFEVAHDATRPFVVRSPFGSVRAVGTKFAVRIDGRRGLAVIVTEGKVLVARSDGAASFVTPAPHGIPVAAGQTIEATGGRLAVAEVPVERIGQELAWRQGDIVFNGEPLRQAAAEMQRYTTTRIVVDPDVARYAVGGYFRTNDLDAFLETVESVFPVMVTKSGGEVRLAAKGA